MLKLVRIHIINTDLVYCIISEYLFRSYFKLTGSFTLSALSGKIMFRDIVYITTDYSFRIQDGWLIFRWWRSYVPKDVSEGKSFFYNIDLNIHVHTYMREQTHTPH